MLIWIAILTLAAAVAYAVFALLAMGREEPPEW